MYFSLYVLLPEPVMNYVKSMVCNGYLCVCVILFRYMIGICGVTLFDL